MVSSLIEWLADHNEIIKIFSFSKILLSEKGLNLCTTLCGLFIKHLAKMYNSEQVSMVEFLLKFHYFMVRKNPLTVKTVMNKLIFYSQVGTYRLKVYNIVRFLLDVDDYSLPFVILDKLLYEVINNPPTDINVAKDRIKRHLKSFEKVEDVDFRARAYKFLRTYFPETTDEK
uniref:Uncharacterized protein n=3 Tax=Lygus hesperus TaxID=30085 RepID=A0A0K8SIA1_LYGHE